MLYLVLCLCLIVPTVEDCVVYQLCMFIMLKCRWKALDISELQNARDMSGWLKFINSQVKVDFTLQGMSPFTLEEVWTDLRWMNHKSRHPGNRQSNESYILTCLGGNSNRQDLVLVGFQWREHSFCTCHPCWWSVYQRVLLECTVECIIVCGGRWWHKCSDLLSVNISNAACWRVEHWLLVHVLCFIILHEVQNWDFCPLCVILWDIKTCKRSSELLVCSLW